MRTYPGVLLLVLTLLAAGCAAPRSPATGDEASSAVSRSTTPTRIIAGLRGSPKVLTDRTSPLQPGHVPGLDALEELVSAGLVHADDGGTVLAQLAEAVPT